MGRAEGSSAFTQPSLCLPSAFPLPSLSLPSAFAESAFAEARARLPPTHTGFPEVVAWLLAAGADLTVRDDNGCTGLHLSCLGWGWG